MIYGCFVIYNALNWHAEKQQSSSWWTELMVEMIKSKDIDRSTTVTMECDDKGLDIDISWWHKFMDSANVGMQIFTRISCKPSDDISHAHLVPESCGSMILTLNTEHWISVGISGDGIWVSWCRCTRCSHTGHAVQCSLTRPTGVY